MKESNEINLILILILIVLLLSSKGLNCHFNFGNWNNDRYTNCGDGCKECYGRWVYDSIRQKYVYYCIKCSDGYYKLGEYICYKILKMKVII